MADNLLDLSRPEVINRMGTALTNAVADAMCFFSQKKIDSTASLGELDAYFRNLNARFPTVSIRYLTRAQGGSCAYPWFVIEVNVTCNDEVIMLRGDTGEWLLHTKS